MISKKRDRQILELLAVRGELSVEEACRKFSISPATARRAFARMAAGGLAEKTWGGLSRHSGFHESGMIPSSLRDTFNAEAKERIKILTGYQINQALVKLARKDALVMHCLPAYRGKEIDDATLEAHAGTIFEEAENRLHVQKAIMNWAVS